MIHLHVDQMEVLSGSWENYLGFSPLRLSVKDVNSIIDLLKTVVKTHKISSLQVQELNGILHLSLKNNHASYKGKVFKEGSKLSEDDIMVLRKSVEYITS